MIETYEEYKKINNCEILTDDKNIYVKKKSGVFYIEENIRHYLICNSNNNYIYDYNKIISDIINMENNFNIYTPEYSEIIKHGKTLYIFNLHRIEYYLLNQNTIVLEKGIGGDIIINKDIAIISKLIDKYIDDDHIKQFKTFFKNTFVKHKHSKLEFKDDQFLFEFFEYFSICFYNSNEICYSVDNYKKERCVVVVGDEELKKAKKLKAKNIFIREDSKFQYNSNINCFILDNPIFRKFGEKDVKKIIIEKLFSNFLYYLIG